MEREKVDRLTGLSAMQIAVLAVAGSTIAAVATLFGVRRLALGAPRINRPGDIPEAQPAVATSTRAVLAAHFSEDTVVPGVTGTGADV